MTLLTDNGSKSRWANMQTGGASQAPSLEAGALASVQGANGNHVRCYIKDINDYILCNKQDGCCDTGCCSNEIDWMSGVYVLIAFVIVTVVVGFVTAIVCYQRSKNKAKKEEAYNQYARSHYTAYPYYYPSQPLPGGQFAHSGMPY